MVVNQLESSGCAAGARIIISEPPGKDPQSAQELNRILLSGFVESPIFAIWPKGRFWEMVSFRFSNSLLEPL